MNVLVTGGCGFVGRKVVERLLAQSPQSRIRVLDNESTCTRQDLAVVCGFDTVSGPGDCTANWGGGKDFAVTFLGADICDADAVRHASRGADMIIHLAANTGVAPSVDDPRGDCVTNVIGTLNVLEACRAERVTRMVFASSGAPLGAQDPPLHEELAPHPASPYGASKLAGEGYCSAYFHSFGISAAVLRFGNVYGPGSGHKGSVVAMFIREALAGERWEIHGDGSQSRDFIYIDDLVCAIMAAATCQAAGGETFQIATGRETSVAELAEMLQAVFEATGRSRPDMHFGQPRTGDVARNFSDTSKAERILGWQSRIGLREGLERTLAWYESELDDMGVEQE